MITEQRYCPFSISIKLTRSSPRPQPRHKGSPPFQVADDAILTTVETWADGKAELG
ncbi:hypothetical protein [Methanogenium sp. MK-MG]|uniref:hypothetical protein n=1 Tax=Methanogenium sp. MK-MG TaxID=2599926 RepID=UPI0013EA5276|nr:hypothetical protein [Methanogenium sp. MK-MG]